METQVKKWGNSLGLRLPKSITTQTNIFDGTIVNLVYKKNRIEIVPIKKEEYSLDEMLLGITDDNIQIETDSGESVGNEILWLIHIVRIEETDHSIKEKF